METRNRYGARRRFESRPVLPVIVVISDDSKTAPSYFDLLKHEVKERRTVRVYPSPRHGANAAAIMEFAASKAPDGPEPADRVFVLIDVDTNPDIAAIRKASAAAKVESAFSNPCYEVWTLAHFEDTGEHFLNCDAVIKRLSVKWKEAFGQEFGRKSQADYSKLMAMRHDAIERCRRRSEGASQSWTEVWRVVLAIVS